VSGDDKGWRVYNHIWMPLKSTVPSAKHEFLEIKTTDFALSQNGVKLQSRFFMVRRCFLSMEVKLGHLLLRKPALSMAVFTWKEDSLMSF